MCELHCSGAHTGTSGMNQDSFTHLQSGTSKKSVVSGDENLRHGRGLGPINFCWYAGQIAFWHDDKLGLRAARCNPEDAIADLPSADRFAHRFHRRTERGCQDSLAGGDFPRALMSAVIIRLRIRRPVGASAGQASDFL
jgi:hypothetical protein